jgi:formylglycine-generating enzyme required for sulfatase activity
MNCVSWFEAAAFCAWDGGFLPSEAQWNYAATAGIEQRAYPWSTPASSLSIDDSRTSYFVDPTQQCHGDGLDGCAPGDILPVGTRPAGDGKWGHSDLGGNVLEWTLDWFADPYPQSRCADCANLTPAMGRVIRGGGFDTVERLHRAGRRLELSPAARQSDAGFRCARAPRTHP